MQKVSFDKEGFREVEAGTVVVMLIVILTNNSCQLFVPVFSHIWVNMRWSIKMQWLQFEVFFEVEHSDDFKGYLFLDMKQWSHGLTVPWCGTCGIVDVVKGYLFLDAVLQLTESVLLLLRQLPIWTLHRLAWDVSIINLCSRINIYITEDVGHNRKYFMKMLIVDWLLLVFRVPYISPSVMFSHPLLTKQKQHSPLFWCEICQWKVVIDCIQKC